MLRTFTKFVTTPRQATFPRSELLFFILHFSFSLIRLFRIEFIKRGEKAVREPQP